MVNDKKREVNGVRNSPHAGDFGAARIGVGEGEQLKNPTNS
jgi:hypothetical protein